MEQTKYSNEFKEDALRLAVSEGVQSASEKLGIKPRQIYDWRRNARLKQKKTSKVLYPGESLEQANKRLEKENDELREANYILKKAMGFFVGR